MKQLNDKIITWLKQHNIDKLSPDKQYLKIIEEVGELAKGLLYEKHNEIKDAIGDIYVAVMGLALQLGFYHNDFDKYIPDNDLEMIKEILYLITEGLESEYDYFAINGYLHIIAINNNLTLKECVEHAYNEIKDRDIKIENGVAVK